MNILSLEGITFSYENGKEVISNISLNIKESSFVGIIGPNGAGKSTLLRLMMGILKPNQGRVMLYGKDINDYSYRERALIMAYVPQESHFNLNFKVIEVVLMGRNPYKGLTSRYTKKEIDIAWKFLKKMGIEKLSQKKIMEISSGERQLSVIARAFTQTPKILFLDEPANHLDLNHQFQLLQIIKDLNQNEKVTIVMVSHSINQALLFCDRLVVLAEGRIVRDGDGEEVINERIMESVWKVKVKFITHPERKRKQMIVIERKE